MKPSFLSKIYRSVFSYILKSRFNPEHLQNNDFTLICNNCVAGVMYKRLNLKFLSPTINLYIPYPDYITFLNDLKGNLDKTLEFTKKSRLFDADVDYPLGKLGEIEIHFIHYHSDKEAAEKWYERRERLNYENIFIIGSERDGCTIKDIESFAKLPFKNKIFFSSKKTPHIPEVIYFKHYRGMGQLGDIIDKEEWLNQFDLIWWLNTGKIKKYHLKKIIYRIIFEH